jgi:hypothetical protein
MTVTLDELEVADPADAWTRAGFTVDSGGEANALCRVGGVRMRLIGRGYGAAPASTSDYGAAPAATSDRGTGIVGWSLRGLPSDAPVAELDGIPTTGPLSVGVAAAPAVHPNGVIAIDHVVLLSPDLGRTVDSLTAIGVNPRRERMSELGGRPIRQIFFRFGEVILEVVGSPETATRCSPVAGSPRCGMTSSGCRSGRR